MLCAVNQEKAPTLRLPIARATRGAMFVLGTVMMVAGFTAVFYFAFPDAWSTLAPKDEIPVDGRVHELEVRADDHMLLVVPEDQSTSCALTTPSGELIDTLVVPGTQVVDRGAAFGFNSGSGDIHVNCVSQTSDRQAVHIRPSTHGDYNRVGIDTLGYIVGGVLFGSAGLTFVLAISSNWARRHRAGRRALRTV